MLTQGHVRASVKKFRKYAYVGGNDWKDRRDKAPQKLILENTCLQMFQKEILMMVEEMLYLSNTVDLFKNKKDPADSK